MKYLFLDTETTGLFDFSKGAHEAGQPRLAAITKIYLEEGKEPHGAETFIKPNGWEMSQEATALHGLTMDYLNFHGVPVDHVVDAYAKDIDDGWIVVAFNAQYDTKVMRGEMRRLDVDDRFERTRNICVMRPCLNICNVPRKSGKGVKLPSLAEASAHFGITNLGEHTSYGDAHAAMEIFLKLRDLGVELTPAVHFAKQAPVREVA